MSNSKEYERKNCKGLYIKLNRKTDADIIEALTGIKNKQGYIKELIRRDLDKTETDAGATYPEFI